VAATPPRTTFSRAQAVSAPRSASPARQPNLADVDAFLVAVSDEIDEAIRARGFDPASLDTNAKAALLDLAAYGALARALRALGDRSPEVLQILVEADAVWSSAMGDTKDRRGRSATARSR
jgi:hypothetical protein